MDQGWIKAVRANGRPSPRVSAQPLTLQRPELRAAPYYQVLPYACQGMNIFSPGLQSQQAVDWQLSLPALQIVPRFILEGSEGAMEGYEGAAMLEFKYMKKAIDLIVKECM